MNLSMLRHIFFALCMVFLLATLAVAKPHTVGFITGAAGLGDESFSDMTYKGLRKAQRRFGFELMIAEPDSPGMVSNQTIDELTKNCDVIVLLGAQYNPLARGLAASNPDKKFVVIEGNITDSPNVASIGFQQHEGAFLAGALAAMVTQTHIIGYIGGTDIPPVRSFLVGYTEGARKVNPEVRVESFFIGGPGDFSGFEKPWDGLRVATRMYNNGVDVIFQVAGMTGNGVIEAARREGKYVIGVDSNQDAMAVGHVLTSMMKRFDEAVYEEMVQLFSGKFVPGSKKYGLREKGVSLTDMRYSRDVVSPDMRAKLEKLKQGIVNGTIVVTNLLDAY